MWNQATIIQRQCSSLTKRLHPRKRLEETRRSAKSSRCSSSKSAIVSSTWLISWMATSCQRAAKMISTLCLCQLKRLYSCQIQTRSLEMSSSSTSWLRETTLIANSCLRVIWQRWRELTSLQWHHQVLNLAWANRIKLRFLAPFVALWIIVCHCGTSAIQSCQRAHLSWCQKIGLLMADNFSSVKDNCKWSRSSWKQGCSTYPLTTVKTATWRCKDYGAVSLTLSRCALVVRSSMRWTSQITP